MSGDHTLLREVSSRYERSRRMYEQAQARGDTDRADEHFSDMQVIEKSIHVTEVNSAWRAASGKVRR
jgi:hypothetical protein